MHWMLSYSLNKTQRAEERIVVRQGPGARSVDLGSSHEEVVVVENDDHHQHEKHADEDPIHVDSASPK